MIVRYVCRTCALPVRWRWTSGRWEHVGEVFGDQHLATARRIR